MRAPELSNVVKDEEDFLCHNIKSETLKCIRKRNVTMRRHRFVRSNCGPTHCLDGLVFSTSVQRFTQNLNASSTEFLVKIPNNESVFKKNCRTLKFRHIVMLSSNHAYSNRLTSRLYSRERTRKHDTTEGSCQWKYEGDGFQHTPPEANQFHCVVHRTRIGNLLDPRCRRTNPPSHPLLFGINICTRSGQTQRKRSEHTREEG